MFSLSSHEDLVTSGCLKYLRYASWKLAVNGIFSKKRLAKKSHRMLLSFNYCDLTTKGW